MLPHPMPNYGMQVKEKVMEIAGKGLVGEVT
jgi:hypothetical protein